MRRLAVLMVVGFCGCATPAGISESPAPEGTAAAASALSEEYCKQACHSAAKLGCDYINNQCSAEGGGPDVVGVGEAVLTCWAAKVVACGSPFGVFICESSCKAQ